MDLLLPYLFLVAIAVGISLCAGKAVAYSRKVGTAGAPDASVKGASQAE